MKSFLLRVRREWNEMKLKLKEPRVCAISEEASVVLPHRASSLKQI